VWLVPNLRHGKLWLATKQPLNALALIALKSGMLEKTDYEYIIEDFISKNAKRLSLFK
jgi:hypothetical protein